MRLAHLSDVHVLDLTGVSWTRFVNKRLTGLVNLVGHRKHAHPTAMLEAAVAELVADRSIDHVVVTGDLTNLALDSELIAAKKILAPLAGRLSVIPGNHDVYTRGAEKERRFEKHFADWMWSDIAAPEYPWLKTFDVVGSEALPTRLGKGVALVGFSSAVARMPFVATGKVSEDQLARLAQLHRDGAFAGRCVVALVHHNLHARGFRKDKMHGLANRDRFIAACAKAGVKVILHGHTHVANRFERDGVTIIGCGSSTWASANPGHVGRYNVYDLAADGLRGLEVRRWDPSAARFVA